MRPRPTDELALLGRSLTDLRGREELPTDVADDLSYVVHAFQRLEKSLAMLLPYLRCDNELLERLLIQLEAAARVTLEPAEQDLLQGATAELTGNWLEDVATVNLRNERLRAVVARIIADDARFGRDAMGDDLSATLLESVEARRW